MANSKYSYVREFEQDSTLLNDCWIVVRVDGRAFSAFSNRHHFRKPNEPRALSVINSAAVQVMSEFDDIVLAYGHSDEYRYIEHLLYSFPVVFCLKETLNCIIDGNSMFDKFNTSIYTAVKILSCVVSLFTSSYCYYWSTFFPNTPLLSIPSFDARIVLYPTHRAVVDYFSWRHVDCHINNQYNTCFWCLILDGKSNDEAYNWLKGTTKVEKNEYLFTSHKLNYNNLPNIFKKGTTLVKSTTKAVNVDDENCLSYNTFDQLDNLSRREFSEGLGEDLVDKERKIWLEINPSELNELELKVKEKASEHNIFVLHCDIVKDSFWELVSPLISD
uniref:tRNA(His) guanylyltransferase n=1 Tax=Theileria annulata TaxID=5874 RepID=A0A3B0MTP1_THEAN